MSSLSFTIEGSLPGLNEIIAANRVMAKTRTGRFIAYTENKRKVEEWIALCLLDQKLCCLESFDAYFHWVEKNARRDPDNVAAGCKFIFDSLVRNAFITGDRAANVLSITHKFSVDARRPRVEVLLVENKKA